MTGDYRGERTVVHVRAAGTQDLAKNVRGLPDPDGNLLIMGTFGSINWSSERDTVHPLLVYSEMLSDGSERAHEAAQALMTATSYRSGALRRETSRDPRRKSARGVA